MVSREIKEIKDTHGFQRTDFGGVEIKDTHSFSSPSGLPDRWQRQPGFHLAGMHKKVQSHPLACCTCNSTASDSACAGSDALRQLSLRRIVRVHDLNDQYDQCQHGL